MIRIRGHYHDGHSSRARAVDVCFFPDGAVVIEGPDLSLRFSLTALRISPRLGRTPRVLTLPDGANCEIPDDDALERHLRAISSVSGASRFVALFERYWSTAILAVALTVASMVLIVRYGIPALAERVAHALPVSVDERLGEGALLALDETFFEYSELDDERRAALREMFVSLHAQRDIELTPRLVFRDGGPIGANAFALPSGIVVVTDQLVELAENTDEIAGVFAHELGHVVHRHALRSVLQQAGVAVMLAAAMGDLASISSLAATLPVFLVELEYSRAFEREADAYAISLLLDGDRPPEALAEMLERLFEATGASEIPEYLSTHPNSDERARAIRDRRGDFTVP